MKILCKKNDSSAKQGGDDFRSGWHFPDINNNVIFKPESIKLIGESGVALQVSCYEDYFQRLTSNSKKGAGT